MNVCFIALVQRTHGKCVADAKALSMLNEIKENIENVCSNIEMQPELYSDLISGDDQKLDDLEFEEQYCFTVDQCAFHLKIIDQTKNKVEFETIDCMKKII